MRDSARAWSYIQRVGRTATSFRALGAGMSHWFDGDRGLVAYVRTRGSLVVAGEPVAAPDDAIAVAEAFVDHAIATHRRVSFFATEGILATSPRFRRVMLGEQPVWDPQSWGDHLAQHRSLREQLRRARAKQVQVRALSADQMLQVEWRAPLEQLVARWLAARPMAPMKFLVAVDPLDNVRERRTFVATRGDVPVAMLSMAPVPAKNGWLFEHLLRDPDAPNGTAELLVDTAMRALVNDGVTWATLGLAPLAGDVRGWLRVMRTYSRPLFNFEGLASFKRKLRPQRWEPIYLVYPREQSSARAMLDGLRAFAGGPLWRFGVHTMLRGPTLLLRMLEWLLIPWTIALAIAPLMSSAQWFPNTAVHVAWVLFDVALLVALGRFRRLSLQHGPDARHSAWRLVRVLAIAVSADTLLTVLQAALWNVPHAHDWLSRAIVAVACAAPALASVVLWGAERRLQLLRRLPGRFPA